MWAQEQDAAELELEDSSSILLCWNIGLGRVMSPAVLPFRAGKERWYICLFGLGCLFWGGGDSCSHSLQQEQIIWTSQARSNWYQQLSGVWLQSGSWETAASITKTYPDSKKWWGITETRVQKGSQVIQAMNRCLFWSLQAEYQSPRVPRGIPHVYGSLEGVGFKSSGWQWFFTEPCCRMELHQSIPTPTILCSTANSWACNG